MKLRFSHSDRLNVKEVVLHTRPAYSQLSVSSGFKLAADFIGSVLFSQTGIANLFVRFELATAHA